MDKYFPNRFQLSLFDMNEEIDYFHEEIFAPTKDILNGYKKGDIDWFTYEKEYENLMIERNILAYIEEKVNQDTDKTEKSTEKVRTSTDKVNLSQKKIIEYLFENKKIRLSKPKS